MLKASRQTLAILLVALCAGCDDSQNGADGGSPPSGNRTTSVILLRYNPGSESTEQRERGFLETLKKDYGDIEILESEQYSGTTPESSLEKSQQLLQLHGSKVGGIFAVCEPNATGVLQALEGDGLAGQVKFVGFDPNPTMVQALADGKMHGMVLQDPVIMGYTAVKTIVAHLNGEKVEKLISTGEYMATPENMREPKMAKLLNPAQYAEEPADSPASPKYRIAVIPKGTTHEFWKSVHHGAATAARELGNVEVLWKGPLLENDRDGQINVVQDFVTKKVNGIVLAPLDSRALVEAVKDAKANGIPTVIFDSGLEDTSIIVSYVATDNRKGGELAARRMAELLGAKAGK